MTEQELPKPPLGLESDPEVSLGPERQAKPQQPLMKRADLPYVVALLAALCSWAVTHVVDRLIELPLVKVTQTVEEHADGNRLTIEFENITSNINFEDIVIRILGETPQNRFSKPNTTIIGGGWDGTANLFKKGDAITLKIPHFHPQWRLELTTDMTGGGTPRLQLESAGVPTILEPVGWRTRLVEWELYIIASFAGFASIFIIVWARTH